MNESIGKLILRVALGGMILMHGIAKLTGGIDFITGSVTAAGLPAFLAYGVYVGEVLAPLLVITGFYSRIGAAIIAINMLFALGLVHGAELFARESATDDTDAEWSAAAGVRKQLSPSFNVDAGIGKTLNGDDRSWFVTIGLAHSFAIRSLMPGLRP